MLATCHSRRLGARTGVGRSGASRTPDLRIACDRCDSRDGRTRARQQLLLQGFSLTARAVRDGSAPHRTLVTCHCRLRHSVSDVTLAHCV